MSNATQKDQPQERVALAPYIEATKVVIGFVRSLHTALTPIDRFMIGTLFVCGRLERQRLSRNQQVDPKQLLECWYMAWHVMALADPALALEAGIRSRLFYPEVDLKFATAKLVNRWVDEYVSLPSQCEHEACDRCDPRQLVLIELRCQLSNQRIVPFKKFYGRFKQGIVLAALDRGERPDENDPDLEPLAQWADVRMVLAEAEKAETDAVLKLLYVEWDGRIGFGAHAVRDTQDTARTALKERTYSLDAPFETDGSDSEVITLEDKGAKERKRDPSVRDERRATRRGLREYVRRELPGARRPSARRGLLEHLLFLSMRRTTMRAVSRKTGYSESTLSEAYEVIRQELAGLGLLRALNEGC